MPLTPIDPATLDIKWRGYRDGSTPTFNFTGMANQVEMQCQVSWASIKSGDAQKYFLGVSELDAGVPSGLSRLMPYTHPEWLGMACTQMRISGRKPDGLDSYQMPKYGHAECSLTLEQIPYDLADDDEIVSDTDELTRYVEVGPGRGSVEAVTIPGGSLKYCLAPNQTPGYPPEGYRVPFNVSVYRSVVSFVVSFRRLPYLAFGEGSVLRNRIYGENYYEDRPYLGTVNQEPIFGYPAGHVLFESVDSVIEQAPTQLGNKEWTLNYNFKYSNIPWGWMYWNRPEADNEEPGWYLIGRDAAYVSPADQPDGWGVFDTRDHAFLFKFTA